MPLLCTTCLKPPAGPSLEPQRGIRAGGPSSVAAAPAAATELPVGNGPNGQRSRRHDEPLHHLKSQSAIPRIIKGDSDFSVEQSLSTNSESV